MHRNSLVSTGFSLTAIAVVMGAIFYFVIQDVCPKCHSNIAVELRWALPRTWYYSHGFAPIQHPEKIPGASQFWFCGKCGLCWLNPFGDADVLRDQGGYPIVRL